MARPTFAALVGFGILSATSCRSSLDTYHCQENSDCRTTGRSGATCESNDLCSFSDPACGVDGQRYGSSSGELSNECVSAGPDASPQSDADLSCFGEAPIPIDLGVPYSGMTSAGTNNDGTCDGTDGPEIYHRIDLSASQVPATLVVTTDLPGTTSDTVLRVWTACNLSMGTELLCFDSDTDGDTREVSVTAPGSYFVVVDSHQAGGFGNYELLVKLQ